MRNLFFAVTTSALLIAPAFAEDCKLTRYGVVPFETDGSHQIFIRSTVGGHPALLMLDTGAYWSLLSKSFVQAKNLPVGNSMFVELRDAGGDTIDKMTIADLKLGNLAYGKTEFFIGGLGGGRDDEDGLLGQNLLAKVDLEIDNANKTLSFFSQDHCKGDGVYWADEAVTLQYKKTRIANASKIKKSDPRQIDMPVVAAELDGEMVSVLFDTGATFTVIDLDHAKRRYNLTPETPGVKPAGRLVVANGGVFESYSYTFASLKIAGITFENVPVRLSTLKGTGSDMLLGMNEMRHLRLYFASKDGMIHITAADAGRTQQ